jgi:hypothetical protein
VGAGPLTGSLERPSQGAQENRKAADASKTKRDQIKAARSALLSAHRAEQKLVIARHAAERQHVIDASRALAAAHRSSLMAAISSKYAERLARVFDSADAKSAWSARERLKLEEAIEIAQAMLAVGRTTAERRRSTLAALRSTHRAERGGLTERQRRQRAMSAVLLGRLRRALREPPHGPPHGPRAGAYRSRAHARPWPPGPHDNRR